MKQFLKRYFLILLPSLLLSSISKTKEVTLTLSEQEKDIILNNLENTYVYLGPEFSNINFVVSEISKFTNNTTHEIHELDNHLNAGYKIGSRNEVEETLIKSVDLLDNSQNSINLKQQLKTIIKKLQNNKLNIAAVNQQNVRAHNQDKDSNDEIQLLVQDIPIIIDSEEINRDPMIEKIEGCLEVTNDALIGRNLTVDNDLLVKGDGEIRGKLEVCDKATFKKKVKFKKDVEFKKSVEIEGDLEVEGDVAIEGDLEVDGNTELKNTNVEGNLSVQEDLVVCGEALFKSNVDILDNLTVHDNLVVCGDTRLKGDVDIDGNLSVQEDLVVCGDAEFKGSVVDVLCDLYVDKNIFMNDTNSPVGNIYKDNVRFIHNFGTNNTFVGKEAGNFTMTGTSNSAFGVNALTANDTGGGNTGLGFQALCSNVSGSFNTAVGRLALDANATGVANTGIGNLALGSFTAGSSNTALGHLAGSALLGGSFNILIGSSAGSALTSGSGNIYIGNPGMAVETSQIRIGVAQTDCFIQGIHDNTVDPGSRQFVFVDSTGKLGAAASPTNLSVLDDLVVCGEALFKSNVDILEDLTVQDNVDIGCDLAVGCNILMNNSTSAAIGNINKGGVRFIHNFGIDNTFAGKGAGNFTLGIAIGNNGFGVNALSSLTTGGLNAAFGAEALRANTTGNSNMAIGTLALGDNTTGSGNVAVGTSAMIDNVTGIRNVAIGQGALLNSIASFNVGIGTSALNFMAGATDTGNIAIGYRAGWFLTSGSDNIYIANNGTATESGQIRIGSITSHTDCYIQGIFGATVDAGTGTTVSVDSDGKLGTVVSSKRFKTNINDMETASDGLMELRPVQFTYKNDANNGVHYGLIAEEVEQVYPELVVRDRAGESYSVRYHELPPMLLNELQKDRKTIQLLQNTIKDLVARIVVLEEKTKQ